jgi:hypothetical protein
VDVPSLEEDVVQSPEPGRFRSVLSGPRESTLLGNLSDADVVHVTADDDALVRLGIGNDSAKLIAPGRRCQVSHGTEVSRVDADPDLPDLNRGSGCSALCANEPGDVGKHDFVVFHDGPAGQYGVADVAIGPEMKEGRVIHVPHSESLGDPKSGIAVHLLQQQHVGITHRRVRL